MADQINIDVKHGKDMHNVKLPATATLNDLKAELARITKVPTQLQRLTGKPAFAKEDAGPKALTALGLKAGGPSNKLMLVGSPASAVQEAIAEPKETAKAKAEFKHFPIPFWRMAPVAGLLADNFVEAKGQGLEGATLHEALTVADLLLTRVNPAGVKAAGLLKQLEQSAELPPEMADAMHPLLRLTARDAAALSKAHHMVRRGAELAAKLTGVVKKEEVPAAVDEVVAAIKAVSRGDWALIPFGFIGMKERSSMLLLVTPTADGVFEAVLINRGVGADDYHASAVATESKVKFAPAIVLGNIPEQRMLDKGWWLLALSQWMRSNDPNVVSEYCRVEVIYDVLLPWLVQKAPADTGVDTLATRIEGVAEGQRAPDFSTPIRSESSAVKGAFSAVAYVLRECGVEPAAIKAVKFAVRYEAVMRSAAELMLSARRWVGSRDGPLAEAGNKSAKSALPASCAAKLGKAITALESCGVSASDATLTLESVLGSLGPKDAIKNENGATMSPAYFSNKVVAVYFSGSWCGYCKQTTPLLKEAYEALQKKYPRLFEVLFVSVDRSPQEFSDHVKEMEWPRVSYPPPKELIESCDVTGVPKLLLFAPGGALMTTDGVAALRADPDVELFPHAPWNGAKPLTDTDARMLTISVGHVAYHAIKRADRGALSAEKLLDIEGVLSAVRQGVRAMPRRPGGTSDTVFPNTSAVSGDAGEAAVDQLLSGLRSAALDAKADTGFNGLDLLRDTSIDAYLGIGFDSSLPALGDNGLLSRKPTTMKELDALLARAVAAVNVLWSRAKHANTASRVAVQCSIMELVTSLFCFVVPMPRPQGQEGVEADFYSTEGFLSADEREKAPEPTPAPGASPLNQKEPPELDPPGEDMQLDMLVRIHRLALSLCTAWQSVDVPTRALDSEKTLTALAMVTVFDAIARNQINSVKCQTLSFILATGFHLSTSLCRNHRPMEEVLQTLEIVRPQLLHTRADIIAYHRVVQKRFPNELFDLRMTDKFEVRKYSPTVDFLRQFMDASGYQLSERAQPGGMPMPPQSEMEQLMGWLCDRRTPLSREHPEFTSTRDIVLLCKFLATMDSRDSQLLRQKKETDEWATWRITFDEDTPGRQMSAGWRTRPEPPVWEMLMVRGRDMDIADITVRGFGDRELLYGEGLVVSSPSDVAGMLNLERPTEDDILHAASLPTFGDALNEEEAVQLLTCLTVGYVRIPLVLDFFTTQDRHTHLFTEPLQKLLRAVIFEPGQFVDAAELRDFEAALTVNAKDGLPSLDNVNVPLRLSAAQAQERHLARLRTGSATQLAGLADTTALLGSANGALLNELAQHRPEAVLAPLEMLVKTIAELGPSSVYSANASYALFVAGLVCDVLSFVRHARLRLPNVKGLEALTEYEQRLVGHLESLVLPLLDTWEQEAVDADDTPTQCVVHSHRALVLRCFPAHAALQQLGRSASGGRPIALPALQRAKLVEHAAKFLAACAFVRVRHGFGMGLQRTQLAMQKGDESLSPEQKLLRFLQSQGLDTTRVTTEQLEQGRRLMLSGGRRRAIFIQIRSRFYSDTVRVPNLIYADPASTADSKALKLPPVDVPEARLFAMLSDDGPGLAALFSLLSTEEMSGIFNASASCVLRDRKKAESDADYSSSAEDSDVEAKAPAATPAADEQQIVTGDTWAASKSRKATYAAEHSGLLFHLPSAEIFWRRNELRPVPDSMSHFTDYEAVLGRDVLQCGLVARHENRHWVHVVGTPFDLCEWTAPNRLDQGVHAPISASQGSACSHCSVLGGGCWTCEKCKSVICGHHPPYCRQCRTRKPEKADEEEPVKEAHVDGVLYNRPFSVDEEAPWPVKKERWATSMVTKVYKTAYPNPGELKMALIMPADELADDATRCVLVANDAVQYDDEESKQRMTWKIIEVMRAPHEIVNVYNLVSHARRMHRVLVYSSCSHLALHTLAPIMKPRSAETLPLMLHHAGEIKKRVHNESTLEIHRHNSTLGGRETYIPSRLLQGMLPSSVLEHFTFWRGADDVLRGEGPAADDPWYGFGLEVRLPNASGGSALVLRRSHSDSLLAISEHNAAAHQNRLRELGPDASSAVVTLMSRQKSAGDLARRSSSRIHGDPNSSRRRLGRPVRAEDLAMLASVFPQLSESVCRLALRSCPRGTGFSGAVEWLTSDKNTATVRAAMDRSKRGKGEPGSPTGRGSAGGEGMAHRPSTDFTAAEDAAIDAGVDATVAADAVPDKDSPMRGARTNSFDAAASSSANRQTAAAAPAAAAADDDDAAVADTKTVTSTYSLNNGEVLVNLAASPKLKALTKFITERLEDSSHVLAWCPLPASVKQAMAAAAANGDAPSIVAEREAKTAQTLMSQIGPLDLSCIEFPRLRLRLVPRRAPEAPDTVRLHVEDNPSWWVDVADEACAGFDAAVHGADAAAPDDGDDADAAAAASQQRTNPLHAAVRALAEPFPQHVMLRNGAGEVQVTVPNHEFRPLAVAGDPLSAILLFDRSSLTWQETVATPCYQYPVHPSGTFLQPPSLAAAMYLVAVLTSRRRYGLAMRYAEACHVDTPFTAEERFMFCMLERTLDSNCPDNDPDAHAVRLRMSHCILHSPNKCPWAVNVELAKYLSKISHVSASCRLSTEEVFDLLRQCNVGHPIIKARLGVLQAAATGRDNAVLKRPAMLSAGQPWAKLLALPPHTMDTNCTKITRIQYREPEKPLADEELVRFLFEDDLLMDEDSGSNRQLGFMFLYMVAKKRIPVTLGTTDISGSFGELLVRYYHLKSARWGREASGQGETEALPSFTSLALSAMQLNPQEHWPDMRDRRALGLMHKGVNIRGQEARETLLPQFWSEIESSLRKTHTGYLMPVARQQSLDAMRHGSRLHEQHHAPYTTGSVAIDRASHAHAGRVLPSDAGCEELRVSMADAKDAERQRVCPLGSVADSFAAAHEPTADERAQAAEGMRYENGAMLPFKSLDAHGEAQTPIARDMLARLEGDMSRYIDMTSAAGKTQLRCLAESPGAADAVIRNPNGADAAQLEETCRGIIAALAAIRGSDATAIRDHTAAGLKLANAVWVDGKCVSSSDGTFDTEKQRKRALASPLLLRRHLETLRRQTSPVTFEWLCGACLSTTTEDDVKRANPFHGDVGAMKQAVAAVMLASVRLHFAQQAVLHANSVLTFVAFAKRQAKGAAAGGGDDVADAADESRHAASKNRLMLLVGQLVTTITAKRFYAATAAPCEDSTNDTSVAAFTVDPRFLVFEFMFSILLRERQVDMVRWFVDNVRRGDSRVQQMLMGQGKTTVVGPLLALILSTNRSLVTQVMPTALLEQSRAILRKCFAVVVPKQVYTLQFDRNVDDNDDSAVEKLVQKLEAAERHRAIVVAPPEAIKALMLKIIEQLHAVEDATCSGTSERTVSTAAALLGLDDAADDDDDEASAAIAAAVAAGGDSRAVKEAQALRRRLIARSRMAERLTPVLDLWRRGVLIMDEVDVLLHPLRSELNFPIGHKQPIDCSGPRWLLPLFTLDAILYAAERCTVARTNGTDLAGSRADVRLPSSIVDQLPEHRASLRRAATDALEAVAVAIQDGYECRALQREPHVALLDTDFYAARIRPAVAAWLVPWYLHEFESQMRSKEGLPADRAAALAEVVTRMLTSTEDVTAMADAVHGSFPPYMVQLLLLGRDWMMTLLPHTLSKINRVGYGLLQPHDFATLAAKATGGDDEALLKSMPVSRRLLAVPFVAKDVPSRSSEFAHPDVVIGLSILASRYEGLRQSDCKAMLAQLKQDYSRQSGRRELRPAARTYNRWVELAAAARGDAAAASVVPLGQLQVLDPVQMEQMHRLLKHLPDAIHYNLTQHTFPRTMAFQQLKVSACGHELGSSMLFSRRIGFSGTPSNLLPLDLGDCSYEPGSDGRIVSALTNPKVTSAEQLPSNWSPAVLLHRVATADPPYHALIDTGALITNMDNRDVAAYLMNHLPGAFDAVVYLDAADRQMALLRANRLTVPVSQCGVPLAKRFTFFDQNHTTGTDVKQAQTAVAVVTIGKDMVFRDYAQGAYRMRGIGQGQRIHLYVIPEVAGRIAHVLGSKHSTGRPEVDVPAWLLLNAMRIEGLQSVKLAAQEVANVFRKRCLAAMLGDIAAHSKKSGRRPGEDDVSTAWRRCLRFRDDGGKAGEVATVEPKALRYSITEFREDITFTVPQEIVPTVPYVTRVQQEVQTKVVAALDAGLPLSDEATATIQAVMQRVASSVSAAQEGADGGQLNSEVVHEQEAEEEQEQEAEQEEQRVSAYSRDDEHPRPWKASQLACDPAAVPIGDSAFYPVARFRCRPQHRALTTLPRCLQMSDNAFRLSWCGVGDRRLKNTIVFLEWCEVERQVEDKTHGKSRYYGVITLAEAETLRWLVHNCPAVNTGCAFALRLLSTGAMMDATALNGALTTRCPAGEGGLTVADARLFFRFLDNDMFFDEPDLERLEAGALRAVPDRDHRAQFFEECLRLRRRHRQQWDDTPVARLLLPPDDDEANSETTANSAAAPVKILSAVDVGSRASYRRMRIIFSRNDLKREAAIKRLRDAAAAAAKVPGEAPAGAGPEGSESALDKAPLPIPMIAAVVAPLLRPALAQRDVAAALAHGQPRDPSAAHGGNTLSISWLCESLFTAPSVPQPPKVPTGQPTMETPDAAAADASATAATTAAEEETEQEWNCGMCSGRNPWCVDKCDFCETAKPKKPTGGGPALDPWPCPTCTFINEGTSRYCSICNADSGRDVGGADATSAAALTGTMEVPEGYWVCAPEKGGCSKFNPNSQFYCDVCDRSRPDLATLRF